MKTNGTRCLFLAVLLVSAVSCTSRESASRDSAKDETMFQSARLQSLMIGNYDGYISVAEFRSCGDIGLGTFGRVDSEMIVLDGTVFQAKADGNVVVADDGVMVPFAAKTDVRLDLTPAFNLYLPEEESFANADLAKDLSSEIESVEK